MSQIQETFHEIRDYDQMPPFFMSVVNASDLWAFPSSSGGLTAGRCSAEHALFPYFTEDRITENASNTGPLTLVRVHTESESILWQPFSTEVPARFKRTRILRKSLLGDHLVFIEENHDLGLSFHYAWRGSPRYGWVRSVRIENVSGHPRNLSLLDGVQNLLPSGVTCQTQNEFSNLLDAYKRNFREEPGSLALYTLSSLLTDLAEPSEALRATSAWHAGWPIDSLLLSSRQVDDFKRGETPVTETDVCGQRGAFLVCAGFKLAPGEFREAHQVFEVDQDAVRIVALQKELGDPASVLRNLEEDLFRASEKLRSMMAAADGLQCGGDRAASTHHLSNVLFNTMRGGLFPDGPRIHRGDLSAYVNTWRSGLSEKLRDLPETFSLSSLKQHAAEIGDPDLLRICAQYLPLTFSRRHGDPSRPWNRFQINLTHPDGSPRLDFQGNWRDLFQNLEALLHSYPGFTSSVVTCFLNATTVEGYNPYRVTRSGIEWERPEPENPWSNIGYWGDHQIIYLLKLLETGERFTPGLFSGSLDEPGFSCADVPYRILPYAELTRRNDGTTIVFDWEHDRMVQERFKTVGADGRMMHRAEGSVVTLSLLEKLLVLLLAKLGNYAPDGGIWMNTQRPEWNDANNALAGRGLSVVTLGYVRRYLTFLLSLLPEESGAHLLGGETAEWLRETDSILDSVPAPECGAQQRRAFMDRLGLAAEHYRERQYSRPFSAPRTSVSGADLRSFCKKALAMVDAGLRVNRRPDGLYHAYNVLVLSEPDRADIRHLPEMLEGQVSILSSGFLSLAESLELLAALRKSALYRADQHSYILYPDKRPPRFLDKNRVAAAEAEAIPLLRAMLASGDTRILARDAQGYLHFHPDFRNAQRLALALKQAGAGDQTQAVLDLYERTFDHQAFTGRSGSMFGYEGLGSIYWHMVSKLLLAVQECCLKAAASDAAPEIRTQFLEAYFDVRNGLGFRKTPEQFGAFPTDPYSHTPIGGGAKQPGMTGQVKEEILTRFTELGLRVHDGCIHFSSLLIPPEEWRSEAGVFHWRDLSGTDQATEVPANAYAFTYNQVCIRVYKAAAPSLRIHRTSSDPVTLADTTIPLDLSASIFHHENVVQELEVWIA